MKDRIFRTTAKERVGFALFAVAGALVNTLAGFLQVYLSSVGISAIAIGFIFLFAKSWDAVNDPLFGGFVDRINLKGGRFIPWVRAANIFLPLIVILMFAIPTGLSVSVKIVWAVLTFLLFDIAYTMQDVPLFAMTSASTDQVHERIKIMSLNSVLAAISVILVSALVPQIYPKIGWLPTAIGVAVLAALFMSFFSRTAKERYTNKDPDKVTIGQMVGYVKSNKYLRIIFIGILVLNITNTTQSVMAFFAADCLGDVGKMTAITLAIMLPALVFAVIMPLLTRRFDKFDLLIVGVIGLIVVSVASYFVGYSNEGLFMGVTVLRGIFSGLTLILQLQFTGDVVEYGEFITGKRLQGIAYSLQTLIFKLMTALAGAAAMFLLGIFGFQEGTDVVQSEAVRQCIWVLFSIFPAIGGLISLLIFRMYKLRDKDVQLMAQANSAEITKAEAQAGFSRVI